MRHLHWLSPALIFCAATTCGSASAQMDWRAVHALEAGGARVSALAVDLSNDAVIAQLNPEQRLTPASTTKIVVAAAALNTWTADKMFQTQVYATAPMYAGQLNGDLILRGGGDPSLTNEALWVMASQLKGAGLKAVSGQLVVLPSPFPGQGCETEDRCEALEHSATAYNAPISSTGVDYGNWCVDVRAKVPGAPALISGCSTTQLPITVQGTIETTAADRDRTFWVERVTVNGVDALRVGGTIPAGDGQRVFRAMSNADVGTGLLLKETLHEIGIEVAGVVSVRNTTLPPGSYALGQAEGLAVKEQLGRMLRFSNNYIADTLTLTMASETRRQPVPTLAEAAQTLSQFVATTHRRKSPGYTPPVLRSGSGLTPENELSAEDLVDVLSYEYRDTRNFGPFYGGFVVPRQAPFTFLKNGSAAWMDRVALKPGTMDDPHSVCSIAGYMRKKDGGWMAFAVLINGGTRIKHVPLYKSMEAIRADVDQILSRY